MYKGAFQTTFLGAVIRFSTGKRFLKYADEIEVPEQYRPEVIRQKQVQRREKRGVAEGAKGEVTEKRGRFDAAPPHALAEPGREAGEGEGEGLTPTSRGSRADSSVTLAAERAEPVQPTEKGERQPNQDQANESGDGEEAHSPEGAEEAGDPNLVTWYGPDDPENPHNWSTGYKSFVATQMAFLTFAVYVGSSIYSSGIEGIMQHFDVSQTTALVGLTTFVIGYGVGPMLWSPLSEFANVGRLPIYLGTLFVFVALQFPTIYANNIHTLLAMRFLAGFIGSPALAVGGATMGDMFAPKHLAYAIGVWGCGAVCGPVIGPLLGGFTYQAKGWTWPLWTLVWLSGACLVFVALFFPETSSKNILHRRANRLRRVTGNPDLKTQEELNAGDRTGAQIANEALLRPLVLMWDPILMVYNTYLALIYGLLYLWFESFPLVFQGVHGFNAGETGLAFLGIFVGAWLSCAVFCFYIYKYLGPLFDANGGMLPKPEIRLYPAPIAAFCIPIAMFGFGFIGQRADISPFVAIVFTGFFGVGAFILFQCIFAYFGDTYYTEIGSVLTINDLFRSSFGAAFPLFANALFKHLGIGGGNALLGGLACLFIPFPFLFIKYGHIIRRKSKWAAQDKN